MLKYAVSEWPGDCDIQSPGDPETQICSPQVTHTLRYSVYGWTGDSNTDSLGDPNYWKMQYNRYWLQPFAKNLIAYRVRIEALIMRIELFFILVFQHLRIEPNIRRIERVSNCVSQPSLWFPAYRNLRIETVSRDMRICVSYRGNAKIHIYLCTYILRMGRSEYWILPPNSTSVRNQFCRPQNMGRQNGRGHMLLFVHCGCAPAWLPRKGHY